MRVAIDISGQFEMMTGIQHYVDSLLNALFAVNTKHDLVPFAPYLGARQILEDRAKDGLFEWRRHPKARVRTAGDDFVLKTQPWTQKSAILRQLANHIDGRVLNPWKDTTRQQRIDQISRKFDLIHVPEAYNLSFTKSLIKRSVLTIYDVTTITRPETHIPVAIEFWHRYFEYAKQHSARVLTISEYSKADIVEHLGIPADRVDVTPLAARASAARVTDAAALRAVREQFGLTDAPFVLYAGTLEPRKNLARLVEAFAQAVREDGLTEHRLVLAGGHWGGHDRELRALSESLGVGPRVVQTGYVSNAAMNALMSSCAAFAYVSEYEGFGLPPLEAMACGAPVVASNTTSLPEVVGEAGVQVDPADVGAIAGALHLLLTDGAENRRRRGLSLSRAGLFSWERTARLTLQSYEAAVA